MSGESPFAGWSRSVGRPAPASCKRVRARKPSTRTRVSHITTTRSSIHRNDDHDDASIAQSPPRRLALEFSLNNSGSTSVCVCLYDGIYGAGDRVGSVLLLLPCHTVTRNGPSGARVTIFSSSSTKTRKKSLLSSVCVCDGRTIIEREKFAEIFRFS